jgi:signal peptidase I
MQKCQNCGFHNEESERRCFQCGAILAESPAGKHFELPPPRSSEPLWWRLYRRLRRAMTLLGRFLVPREPERELPRRRALLALLLGLLPGLGQLYNHQYRKALRFFLLFLALVILNIVVLTKFYSNLLLLVLGATVVFSATDATASASVINGSLWTPLKSLMIASYILFMLGLFFSLMQLAIAPGVQLVYVSQDVLVPALRKGDRVVVDRLAYRFREPRRGEIVLYKPAKFILKAPWLLPALDLTMEDQYLIHSKNNIERIVGMPGETVELKKGAVYINGKEATAKYSPLVTDQLVFDCKVAIPENCYCIIYSVAPIEDGPIVSFYAGAPKKDLRVPRFDYHAENSYVILTDEWAKASIVPKSEIIGLIRCVYNPPKRRRWL